MNGMIDFFDMWMNYSYCRVALLSTARRGSYWCEAPVWKVKTTQHYKGKTPELYDAFLVVLLNVLLW